ncbi:fam-a protein [Plasmodium chabaudi chabaudi]|uniref:Fam-a protein n=1 Tax=Plasmodium chabaudi chabaudi TaxID=31271 RepID=A0A4V0K4I9_PLACU|nr:fam-a protein [Plasmodium chabaudi chabaudi]VTZ67849.1 fam-a protein [Plasmodium chabaudi chabaudi]|eukprot:XP_016652909.1 fam-a protein [Plasmodium chabaudi chabaudi]
MNKGNFNAVFLLLSLFVYANNKALAAELDEHNAASTELYEHNITSTESDEHNATIIKEDEHDVIPTESDEHDVIPTEYDEHNVIPTESDEHNVIPTESDEHNVIPTESDEHNAIPTESDEHNVIPTESDEHNVTPAESYEHNGTPAESDEHNGTPAESDEHNATPAESDEHNGTPAESDEHNAIPTESDEHNATIIKEDEHDVIPTEYDEHNATPAESDEHNVTPAESDEHNGTPAESDEHNAIPTESDEHNATIIKEDEHDVIPTEYDEHDVIPTEYDEHNVIPTESDEHNVTPAESDEHNATPAESDEHNATPAESDEHNATPAESFVSEIAQRIANLNNESSNGSLLMNPGSEMRYKIHKHLLCMDPKETEKAIKHASEAVALLLKIGSNTDGYNVEFQANNRTFIYSKKVENIDIGKFITKANSSDKYDEIINVLWDSNGTIRPDLGVMNGNVARVYNPNLLMMEKSHDAFSIVSPSQITYALATKVEISDDTTVILCPSININYLNKNHDDINVKELLKNVKPIETDIDAEEALIKLASNISGFIIKKNEDSVDVTYIHSIYNGDKATHFLEDLRHKRDRSKKYSYIMGVHANM